MTPPDQDITVVEYRIGKALFRIIERKRFYGKRGLFLKILSDLIAEKVFISLFLPGLSFIPNNDSNRFCRIVFATVTLPDIKSFGKNPAAATRVAVFIKLRRLLSMKGLV
jgi:hypothetical protein